MKGIAESTFEKIKSDIQSFKNSYVTAEKFKSTNVLKFMDLENKIESVENAAIIRDYAVFKRNVLKEIDTGNDWNKRNYKFK